MASMLDCKKVQPRISEYIDNATDSDSAWAINLHLASCAVCSRIVDELTQTANLLRNLPEREISPNFEAALALRLADQVLKPRRPAIVERLIEWWDTPRVRPIFASAAALAAVIPVAFVVAYRSGETASEAHKNVSSASEQSIAASDPGLNEMWNEHLSYASSEPLADSGGMLQARANSSLAANNVGSDSPL